jgi:hypothetical protein
MYLDTRTDAVIEGDLTLDDSTINGPKFTIIKQGDFLSIDGTSISINAGINSFLISNSGSEVAFKSNVDTVLLLKENEAPSVFHSPTKAEHLTNMEYIQNTYLPLQGGTVENLNIVNDFYVGLEQLTDYSSIYFNYGKVNNPKFYFDNNVQDFKIDIQPNDEFTLYHSGNLDISDLLKKSENSIISGSIELFNNDTVNPAYLQVSKDASSYAKIENNKITVNNGLEFNIDNTNAEVNLNVGPETVLSLVVANAPETTFAPVNDESLVNKLYVDSNFLNMNNDSEINGSLSVTKDIKVGVDSTSNSVIYFNYDSNAGTTQGSLYYDNATNDFKVNPLTGQNFSIYHEGNLDPLNFVKKDESSIIKGSISLDTQDLLAPAIFSINNGGNFISMKDTTITLDRNASFSINLTDTNEVDFIIETDKVLTLKENTAPVSYYDPTSDNHLVRKSYSDDTYFAKTGGVLSGSLSIDTGKLVMVSDDSTNDANEIAFARPDGTYRFTHYSHIDDSQHDFNMFDATGTTLTNQTSLISDGNVRVLSGTIPTNDMDLCTKKYTDDNLVQKADNTYVETRLDEKLDLTGGTLTGTLTIGDGNAGANLTILSTAISDASVFFKNSSNIVKGAIALNQVDETIEITGKTIMMSGAASNVSPIEDSDLTTKDYVDNAVALKTFTTTANTPTRAVIDDIVGNSTMSLNDKKHFRIITKYGTGHERLYLIEYFEELDKYGVRRLSLV